MTMEGPFNNVPHFQPAGEGKASLAMLQLPNMKQRLQPRLRPSLADCVRRRLSCVLVGETIA